MTSEAGHSFRPLCVTKLTLMPCAVAPQVWLVYRTFGCCCVWEEPPPGDPHSGVPSVDIVTTCTWCTTGMNTTCLLPFAVCRLHRTNPHTHTMLLLCASDEHPQLQIPMTRLLI